MKDLGLYRVSGVLSEIQRLKKAFEKGELNKNNIYVLLNMVFFYSYQLISL